MKQRRGIYLLPNLFTTTGLFAGFYSIISSINEQFEVAAIAIIIAMFMDGLDGPIARLTNTQTNFGLQYDSLADMVSFGLAPALLCYQWVLFEMNKLGWLAVFFYAASTALRLARFNVQSTNEDKQFFQGLPSPASAVLIASVVWCVEIYGYADNSGVTVLLFPMTVLAGVLMVSNIRFYKLNINFKDRVPFIKLILLLVLFVLIAIEPPLMFLVIALIYAISGPIMTLISVHKYRAARNTPDEVK